MDWSQCNGPRSRGCLGNRSPQYHILPLPLEARALGGAIAWNALGLCPSCIHDSVISTSLPNQLHAYQLEIARRAWSPIREWNWLGYWLGSGWPASGVLAGLPGRNSQLPESSGRIREKAEAIGQELRVSRAFVRTAAIRCSAGTHKRTCPLAPCLDKASYILELYALMLARKPEGATLLPASDLGSVRLANLTSSTRSLSCLKKARQQYSCKYQQSWNELLQHACLWAPKFVRWLGVL